MRAITPLTPKMTPITVRTTACTAGFASWLLRAASTAPSVASPISAGIIPSHSLSLVSVTS
jgi:hypothetical protein